MADDIQVIDRLLSPEEMQPIQDLAYNAPIYRPYPGTVMPNDDIHDVMFARVLFNAWNVDDYVPHSDKYLDYVYPLLNKIGVKILIRCRLVVTAAKHEDFKAVSLSHIDSDIPCKVAIFYINSCNGGTKFTESGKFVESTANRVVLFPSHVYHSAITTTDTKFRHVININYH